MSRLRLSRNWLYIPLIAMAIFYLLPMYVMLVTGFKGFDEIDLKTMWDLPRGIAFDNYIEAFSKLAPSLGNSFLMVIPSALLSSALGSLNGYILAKWKFRGADIIFPLILFGMFIPYQAVLIVANEVGLFKKHNLDPTLVFTTGGSLGIQAMLGGDVAMTLSDGSSSVGSKLAGVDVLVIASLLNTFPYSLISLPEIKKVDQLKGSKIAVSRFGSATDLSVKMALAKVGLNAEKDVTLLQIGVQTARYAAKPDQGLVTPADC